MPMLAMNGLAAAAAASTPSTVVSTRMLCSSAPSGFSANSVTCPLPSIFMSPNALARFSSHGSAAIVIAAPLSRCLATNSR